MTQKFLCYTSGILSGTAEITNDGVRYTERSYYNDRDLQPILDPTGAWFHAKLLETWSLAVLADWNGEYVTIGAYEYERNCSFVRGVVYAQMHSNTPLDIVTYDGKAVGFMIPSRNESQTLVMEGYEDCTNLSLWQNELLSKAEYQITDVQTYQVAMRDGIKLATDVVLPNCTDIDSFPTLLIRTCYDKNSGSKMWHKYAKRGYVVVVQDVRGREASEGEWLPFANEIEDGDDTLNWIADQPWSDGQIGMLGGSYLGYVQWAAAANGNPHLKALVSQVTAGSAFTDLPRRGGTFESGVLAWSFMIAEQKTNLQACVRDDWDQIMDYRPICDIPKKALGKSIPFYDQWMQHPCNDDFWKRSDWSLHHQKIDVPALYISGWFDDNGQGTTQSWDMNAKNQRGNQRMILGPWLHKTNSSRKIHEFELSKNALRYDLDVLYLQWFDHFLKQVDNGIENRPNVEYYMTGEDQWHTAKSWPPLESVMTEMYLHCHTQQHDGTISFEDCGQAAQMQYQYNPENPFPYVIDVSENECAIPGNYKAAEKRDDVLLFTSQPLEKELSIAGYLQAHFYASSSCTDTDWVVRVTDVDEQGNSFRLSDGLVRARHRNSCEHEDFLVPGKIEEYTIDMTKIAHTFKVGHQIRVQITSSAENFCFPNSNMGQEETKETRCKTALQKIFTGPQYPSSIRIPILQK